jgi:predicted Zn-dependent protease
MKRISWLASAGLLLLVVSAMLSWSGCRGTNLLSKQDEIEIGKQGAAAIEKEYKLDTDPKRIALVQEIGQRVLEGMRKVEGKKAPDFPFSFKVLDTKEVNAVSLPGGPVYVFRGLMEQVGDDKDMLAAVLAHEVAHIVARHAAKQISSGILADLVISLGTRGARRSLPTLRHRWSCCSTAAMTNTMPTGALSCTLTPLAMTLKVWCGSSRSCRKLEKSPMKGLLANLRTHPLTENRILRAKKLIAELPDRQPASAATGQ